MQIEVLQFEMLNSIELNPKLLTKSIILRTFDRAHEFTEHLIRTFKANFD